MNCNFCQQPCKAQPENETSIYPYWICENHKYKVSFYTSHHHDKKVKAGEIFCISMDFIYRNIKYAISWEINDVFPFKIYRWNSPPNGGSSVVLQLNYIPTITPDNIDDKLPVWLTFI